MYKTVIWQRFTHSLMHLRPAYSTLPANDRSPCLHFIANHTVFFIAVRTIDLVPLSPSGRGYISHSILVPSKPTCLLCFRRQMETEPKLQVQWTALLTSRNVFRFCGNESEGVLAYLRNEIHVSPSTYYITLHQHWRCNCFVYNNASLRIAAASFGVY